MLLQFYASQSIYPNESIELDFICSLGRMLLLLQSSLSTKSVESIELGYLYN